MVGPQHSHKHAEGLRRGHGKLVAYVRIQPFPQERADFAQFI